MTAVLSGTNGLLQSYDYQVLTTGFSYTFAAGVQVLVIQPAGTLATGTVTMPAAPTDGMTIAVVSTQQVTAVTVSANTGQSIVGAPSQLVPNQPLSWVYRLANTTWYPFFGGAGRATSLVSGTAVASTSGTSIDFTGIPSWAERITVMFSGVSTNGSSHLLVQIGAGSVTTSGYTASTGVAINSGAAGFYASSTAGFLIYNGNAANIYNGTSTIFNVSSNAWVNMHVIGGTDASRHGGGSIGLGGTLDRVRITTVNGTDTFDLGTINILYE
jgi:hypothetical protein